MRWRFELWQPITSEPKPLRKHGFREKKGAEMSAPFVVFKYDLQRNVLRHARFCMARNVARELNVVVTVEMPQ